MATGQPDAAEGPQAPSKPLNQKQLLFAYHYARLWKGAPAARNAGYSANSAKQQAKAMLEDPRIVAAIKEEAEKLGMSVEEAKAKMSEWGRVSIDDVMTKEVVEYTPRILKPLQEIIDALQQEIILEEWALKRAEKLLPYRSYAAFKIEWSLNQLEREKLMKRLELRLSDDPKAKDWVDGPVQSREIVKVDLVKVHDLKAGHMIKKVTPTRYGIAVELHDAKEATTQMLKIHGAYAAEKHDITTNGNDLPGSNIMMPDNGRG